MQGANVHQTVPLLLVEEGPGSSSDIFGCKMTPAGLLLESGHCAQTYCCQAGILLIHAELCCARWEFGVKFSSCCSRGVLAHGLCSPALLISRGGNFFRLESHQPKEFTPALEWCLVDPLETENSATDGLPPSSTSFFYFCCLENSFTSASTPFRSPCTGGCCAHSGSVGTPSSWAAGAWQAWAGI